MATPKAAQLEQATGFTPNQKAWVKALVSEAVSATTKSLQAEILTAVTKANSGSQVTASTAVKVLEDRIETLAQRFEEDDKYSLTKAKLVRLMKAMGID
jgi:hypothetical protein